MPADLRGKVVLVTGVGRVGQIGHAVARGLGRAGAKLLLADVNAVGLADRVKEFAAEGIAVSIPYPSLHTLEPFHSARFAPRQRSSAPRIDYASLSLPNAEHAAANTVWLEHRMLLADPEDVLDIVRAGFNPAARSSPRR